jgi:4-carboxymuconolactone decarboxylase
MPTTDTNLGGRIELLEPSAMTGSRKALYDSILREAVPWAQSSGFVAALPDGRVIGPFNVALQSPEIGAVFAKLQSKEESSTTLSPRVRQIVILTVGAIWQCDYERYAHKAVAKKVGFSQQAIDALANGSDPQGLSEEELLACRLTTQIALHHKVSQDLFESAQAAFGNQGIVDLLFLAGCYFTVCSLLNTFEVPVPNAGAAK